MVAGSLILVAGLLGLAAAWRWTPLSDWLSPQRLSEWVESVQSPYLQLALVMGAYVVGGMLVLPLTVLVIATAIAFGPWLGLGYAMAGAMASALVSYAVGALIGRNHLLRMAGSRIDRLSRTVARRGVLGVVTVRLVPLAPYTLVNVAIGASHVRLVHFALGTFLGLLPGLVSTTLLAGSLYELLFRPSKFSLLMLGLAAVFVIASVLFAVRWRRQHPSIAEGAERAERD